MTHPCLFHLLGQGLISEGILKSGNTYSVTPDWIREHQIGNTLGSEMLSKLQTIEFYLYFLLSSFDLHLLISKAPKVTALAELA